ncbi:MAG TPA: adenylate/guanylate cyclase domain-containing protein, partial [Anaerolineae bacterium]|nr:adenylate/guanylate cyclase domain-containing protein [Anaerolineae bacterium]
MSLLEAYIPSDRRQATARGEILPDRATGAVMFADISGFTRLTDALVKEMGPRRGIDEFIQQLNRVYDALIAQVDRYGGSVVSFSGDAITCWFEEKAEGGTPSRGQVRKAESFSSFILPPSSFRAVACALEMQQAMSQFAAVKTPAGATVSLAIKIAVATGPVRRFLVGDPHIQYLDILAGQTLDRLARIDQLAQPGEILVGPQIVANLGDRLQIAEWREEDEAEIEAKADEVARRGQAKAESRQRFAVITDLSPPPSTPPPLQPSILPPLHPSTPPLLTEAQIRPWLLPPVYDRLKSGQGQFLAELRPAVALFVKFGGLDYDGDEAAGIKLDAYIRWAQHIL